MRSMPITDCLPRTRDRDSDGRQFSKPAPVCARKLMDLALELSQESVLPMTPSNSNSLLHARPGPSWRHPACNGIFVPSLKSVRLRKTS